MKFFMPSFSFCLLCNLGLSLTGQALADGPGPQPAVEPAVEPIEVQAWDKQDAGFKDQKTPVPPQQTPKAASKKPDLLQFFSGQSLPMQLQNIDVAANQLEIDSKLLVDSALFKLDSIKSLRFNSRTLQGNSANTVVQMTNGDVINARLLNIGNELLELESDWGGKININKKFIANVNFRSLQNEFYSGPNSLDEWNLSDPELVKLENAKLQFNRESLIYKQDLLQDKVHVSFDVSYTGYGRIRVLLFGKNNADNNEDNKEKERRRRMYNRTIEPENFYELMLQPRMVYLRREWNGKDGQRGSQMVSQINNFQGMPDVNDDGATLKVDVFADLKKGKYFVYCNGEKAGELLDNSIDEKMAKNFGLGFGLGNGSYQGCQISGISLRKWNGTPPRSLAERRNRDAITTEKASKSGGLQLANGDVVSGDIVEVKDGFFVIKSPNYEARLPVHLASNLNLAVQRPVKQRKMQQDVLLRLLDNTQMTLQLRSFSKDKLKGWSEALGEVEVDMQKVKNIDLNLYKIL